MIEHVRATVSVYYHMPSHPSLLQLLAWQCDDEAPRLPRVARYLDHWRREVDAVVASVEVALARAGGTEYRRVDWLGWSP